MQFAHKELAVGSQHARGLEEHRRKIVDVLEDEVGGDDVH